MKTKDLFSIAVAGLLFLSSCASEDTANKQNEQEPGTEGLTGFVEEAPATRTTADYDGSGLNFYWTAGDRMWVNNTAATPALIQDAWNDINDKLTASPVTGGVQRAAKAKFYFNGTYTASSYPVRYTGKNGVADKVTIKANQTQTIPNDASHIGEDGDFGVATAQKQSDGKYHFTLDHKAAYLTFMPYTTQTEVAGAKIQKIRVFTGNTSDALAGTFDLADDGTLSNPASTSNSVELIVPDFSIPSTSTYATNGATMVVNPGTYNSVSIEYTVHDPVSNITGTITKTYPSVTFTAGLNKKVHTNLQVRVYTADSYYMWDAQQNYWYGHLNSDGKPDSKYNLPRNKTSDPDRYFNDVMGYTDPTGTAPAVLPTTPHFLAIPNANELRWYVEKGDPHWDGSELWAFWGHLYTGGMWFKKKSKISGYSATQAPNGIDYTRKTTVPNCTCPISQGKPNSLNDYFYLAALGTYTGGLLDSFGTHGLYWTTTPYNGRTDYSHFVIFNKVNVRIYSNFRTYGMQLWTAQ